MGKNSLTGVEILRRKAQSLKDSENYRRQQQSGRDRECNRRHQARVGHQSLTRPDQILTKLIEPSVSAHRAASPPSMALRTLPWKVDSKSGVTFASLFNDTQYSDVTVYLGESKVPFAAHVVVLGTRCPYFDDMFRSGFKESTTKEISFEEDSPHALWRAFRYIYTGDYSDEPSETLTLEMYSTTNNVDSNGMRIAVVNAVAAHKEELVQKRPFQDLIREVGDFAVDLVLNSQFEGSFRVRSSERGKCLPLARYRLAAGNGVWTAVWRHC
ncbi:hypothetical protein BKA61DRAFT_581620 [Leptodontidium sp. MPI-SDFR-AT-0119]|nr:hypothetical protein BKA61DRAFT_581620 [Leptodontidium sp. MPI-SDFR-AT-0119]